MHLKMYGFSTAVLSIQNGVIMLVQNLMPTMQVNLVLFQILFQIVEVY